MLSRAPRHALGHSANGFGRSASALTIPTLRCKNAASAERPHVGRRGLGRKPEYRKHLPKAAPLSCMSRSRAHAGDILELTPKPDIRGLLAAAAIAIAADDRERHAGVEAMRKANADAVLAM